MGGVVHSPKTRLRYVFDLYHLCRMANSSRRYDHQQTQPTAPCGEDFVATASFDNQNAKLEQANICCRQLNVKTGADGKDSSHSFSSFLLPCCYWFSVGSSTLLSALPHSLQYLITDLSFIHSYYLSAVGVGVRWSWLSVLVYPFWIMRHDYHTLDCYLFPHDFTSYLSPKPHVHISLYLPSHISHPTIPTPSHPSSIKHPHFPPKKPSTISVNLSGFSTIGKCPAPSTLTHSAPSP